jgi:hypothetical protein
MLHGLKDWLVKWDIWPILWPFGSKGEDGWIPAAIMAGSAIASQLGGKKGAKDQRSSEQQRIDEANRLSGESYENQLAHNQMIQEMFGPGGEYSALLTDPITSTMSGSSSYSSDTTPTFTAEGQTAIGDMLKSAMSERARAESLPEFAGMEEGMARDYGQRMSSLKTALGNRAATRGAAPLDTELEGILAGRGITSDFLGQKQQIPMMMEQARLGKGNVANMLMSQVAGLGRGQKTRGRSSQQSTTQQGQGAGGIMNYLNMIRPPERTTYV